MRSHSPISHKSHTEEWRLLACVPHSPPEHRRTVSSLFLVLSQMKLSVVVFAIAFVYTVAAVETSTASTQCKLCLSNMMHESLRILWTTSETALRGFLLGFGGAILKDLLIDRKASADTSQDFSKTLKFAKLTGLGAACFLVGSAVVLPARWRYELLRLE